MDKKGILYLIPTPIGNMDDLSKRIIDTLNNVDVLFCEDTRTTSILLNYLGIKKKMISNHKFNEKKNIDKILDYLKNGSVVGIVSDRGTPIISDPGYILTDEVIKNGYQVIGLPGPTAFVPALIVSGLSSSPFLFYGFLNSKSSQRKKELENLKYYESTLIFYEAPHRLEKTIIDMGNIFNKIDELKGEFVIVVAGNKDGKDFSDISLDEHIDYYLKEGYTSKDAIKLVAKDRNMSKSEVYKYYHTK